MSGRHRLPPNRWRRFLAAALVVSATAALAAALRTGLDPVYVAAPEPPSVEPTPPPPTTTSAPPTTTTPAPTPSTSPTPTPSTPPRGTVTTTVRPPPPKPTTRPPPPKPAPPPVRACPSSGFGGVRPHVARAGYHLAAKFGINPATIGGVRNNAIDRNGHPAGRALDVFVTRAKGDAVAAYALANRAALGIEYVLWRQRYNDGSGWEPMADRGSVTANHYTHIHINFRATPGTGVGVTC